MSSRAGGICLSTSRRGVKAPGLPVRGITADTVERNITELLRAMGPTVLGLAMSVRLGSNRIGYAVTPLLSSEEPSRWHGVGTNRRA